MYEYKAVIVHVHDGDTLSVTADLGFEVLLEVDVRLLGCNARELSQPGGTEARDHLIDLLPIGTSVVIKTVKPDKFGGRYDAAITLADGSDLVLLLIAQQWVAPWNGRGTKPVPPWPRTVTP